MVSIIARPTNNVRETFAQLSTTAVGNKQQDQNPDVPHPNTAAQ
jgi:hypothetical protein